MKIMKKIIVLLVVLLLSCQSLLFSQVSDNVKQQIIDTYVRYAESTTIDQRLQYIRNPGDYREFLLAYYTDRSLGYTPKRFGRCTENNGWFALEEYVEARRGNQSIEISVNRFFKKIGNDYKLDWESSNAYNPISWQEFIALKSGLIARMRCIASLWESHYDGYFGIRISDYIGNYQFVAYIDQDSENGKKLFELLRNGGNYAVILDMKYINRDELHGNSFYSKQVIITEYIQRRWYID
jgi:hypothetical protein